MNHDEKRKKGYFQIVGYCLTPKNELQVMFAFYGPTASNGKSDAIDIITRIIKKENVSHISIEEFSEKFSNVGIADKLLNVSTEVTNKKILDTAVLKKVVTGDLFEGNVKHVQKRQDIKPYAKLIFCANELPQVNDKTEGYYRRIICLLFENKFDPKTSKFKVDDFCTQKNLDYIGNKSLSCFLEEYKKDKFTFANKEESDEILAKYRKINDTVIGYLNDEDSIVYAEVFDVKKTEVLDDYRKYCKENKKISLPRIQFYEELLEKSDIEKHIKDGIDYLRRTK